MKCVDALFGRQRLSVRSSTLKVSPERSRRLWAHVRTVASTLFANAAFFEARVWMDMRRKQRASVSVDISRCRRGDRPVLALFRLRRQTQPECTVGAAACLLCCCGQTTKYTDTQRDRWGMYSLFNRIQ